MGRRACSLGPGALGVGTLVLVLGFGFGLGFGFMFGPGARPAAAHICALDAQIPVGRSATVLVLVTVEDEAVPDVELDVPAGLRLERADPAPGWTPHRTGTRVRYRGGPAAPFSCPAFVLRVTATARGVFELPVTQRRADGTVVARVSSGPTLQLVYAGVTPPAPPGGRGVSPTAIAGALLIGAALALFGGLQWRARRAVAITGADGEDAGARRAAELRARADELRKQARARRRRR